MPRISLPPGVQRHPRLAGPTEAACRRQPTAWIAYPSGKDMLRIFFHFSTCSRVRTDLSCASDACCISFSLATRCWREMPVSRRKAASCACWAFRMGYSFSACSSVKSRDSFISCSGSNLPCPPNRSLRDGQGQGRGGARRGSATRGAENGGVRDGGRRPGQSTAPRVAGVFSSRSHPGVAPCCPVLPHAVVAAIS